MPERESHETHERLILNTPEDDVFTEIPMRFGWLDPDEQRKRGRYLAEIGQGPKAK